jgi:uncharacterized phage protein gp47/JayE
MAVFQFKTESEIIEDIRKDLESSETPATDWSSGSANRTFWEVAAKLGANQQYMLARLYNLMFADSEELTGDSLDRRAMERAVFRKLGTKSSGFVLLSRSTPAPFDIFIPAGTTFSTVDRTVTMQTKADVIIQTGQTSATVQVEAVDIGQNGNLSTSTPLIQAGVAVVGIESASVSSPGLSGGTDTETDDELHARFLEAIQYPENGGSVRDYIRWAKEVTGVVGANCIELARGAGTTDVVILSTNGIPSSDLIEAVKIHIAEKRPACADVLIRGPQSVTVNITLTYSTNSVSPLEQKITDVIQKYIASVGVGGTVRVAQIYNVVMDIPEIKDMTLASPAQNLALSQDQIAVMGTVTITKEA